MAEKVQVNADKLKVLNAVMEKIEKDFGKGSIMRMNSQEVNDVPVIPTGSITLDMALGVGGYPKGLSLIHIWSRTSPPCGDW